MHLLEVLASDKNVTLYRKELNKITGSVTATILLSQIMYWSSKNQHKPFYKFKQPCKHRLYSDGDSWCEELGFTRHEFDTALKKLEQAQLVERKTNMDRVTYYQLNTENLSKALSRLYVKPESVFMESRNASLDLLTETASETTTLNPYVELKHDDTPYQPEADQMTEAAKETLEYLNLKTGRSYRPVANNLNLIKARLKEGATQQEAMQVIDRKCQEWLNDQNMSQYLRPATLFNATKFNNYLGALNAPMPPQQSKPSSTADDIDFNSTGWLKLDSDKRGNF